jgi:hypothetical protein
VLYLDTTALAQLHIAEPDSRLVSKIAQVNSWWLATRCVTYAEMLSVLNRCLSARRLSSAAHRLQKKTSLEDWAPSTSLN